MSEEKVAMNPSESTLYSLFQHAAKDKGQDIFFADEYENCSGVESLENVACLAGGLLALGITKGDRVAFICGSSVRHILLYFACQHIGAIPCALHLRNTEEGISKTLNWLGASLLVVDKKFLHIAHAGLAVENDSIPLVIINEDHIAEEEIGYMDLHSKTGSSVPPVVLDPVEPAKIILSSGTTGEPKGIVHSQKTLYESAIAGTEVFGDITGEDSVLVIMSPSFAAWNHVVLSFLACSARIVFNNVFDPDLFLRTLESEHITNTALVPTAWRRVIASINASTNFSDLNLAFFSGEPGTPEFIELMQKELPKSEVRTAYLTSEGGVASACVADPVVLSKNISSVGKPVSGASIRLVNPDGSIEDEVAKGETGEILVRGKSMALAYWDNEELTEKKFENGWWRSGDLGSFDDNGYLSIVGRSDNMIISGGLKVHAEEVEAGLLQHPAIDMVAVIGKNDPDWGQRIEAFVVTKSEISAEEILNYCRDHKLLTSFKLPKRINFCDSLPTGATGKIYRRGLLEES
jgi:acyl-CoA synthetase (AMP-forming)/AMP-acid ligase II